MIKRAFCLLLTLSFALQVLAGEVDTVMIKSISMNKMIRNLVIKPNTYADQTKGFAVLYLLHGAGGNQKDWLNKAPEDMFKIYKYVPDKIKSEDYNRCTTTSYVYKTYPSCELKLEVDLPEGDGTYPYIIWIHGGGWRRGNFYGHKNLSTYLASNGIAGIRISYSLFSQGVTFKDT